MMMMSLKGRTRAVLSNPPGIERCLNLLSPLLLV